MLEQDSLKTMAADQAARELDRLESCQAHRPIGQPQCFICTALAIQARASVPVPTASDDRRSDDFSADVGTSGNSTTREAARQGAADFAGSDRDCLFISPCVSTVLGGGMGRAVSRDRSTYPL